MKTCAIMLRVFKVCSSYNNLHALHPHLLQLPRRRIRCSLCHQITDQAIVGESVYFLTAKYSTSVPAHLINNDKKKKRIRKRTNYTDLLEVSKEKTSERRTKIKTLNASSLYKIHGDEAKLNDLHDEEKIAIGSDELAHLEGKDEGISACGEDQLEIADSPELVTETAFDKMFSNEVSTLKQTEYRSGKSISTNFQREVKEKLARVKASELEKSGKEASLNSSLVSYVELCMNCGFLNRGLYTVNHYLRKNNVPVSDIRVFNTLFEGLARYGKYDKLLEVWQSMTTIAKLKPDSVSFARRFEAIARSSKRDKVDLLHLCLRLMQEQGISLDDIFRNTEWRRNSREVVLSAIKVLRQKFEPKIQPPNTSYNCHLADHLNQPPETPMVSPGESLFSPEDLKTLFKEQFHLEMNTYVNIKSIDANKIPDVPEYTQFCREQLEKLENMWDKSISAALNRDIAAMCAIHKNLHRNGSPINIYPYLTVLNRADYVDIIKHEVKKLAMGSETYSPAATILCKELGNFVKMRYDIKTKQCDGIIDKVEKIYCDYLKWYLNPNVKEGGFNSRHTWQLMSQQYQEGPSLDTEAEPWPHTILIAIGKFLYNIILRDIKVDVNILKQNSKTAHFLPAFYTVFRYQMNLSCEEVKPHPVLSRLFRAASLPHLVFSVTDLPMLSPPLPWTSIRSGGYLLAKAPIIRLPNSAIAQRERLKEAPTNQLFPCFDSLNQLGSIPWKVNTKILDVVLKLFNSGGNEKLNVPPPPPPTASQTPLSDQATKAEKLEAFKALMLEKRRKAEMYSLWCDALYRLSLANHFRDKIFWLPHNMDFRGRTYPCPPHLSHLGSDLYRSLVVFAKKEPLGTKGLDWLKLHAINLTGIKKRDSIDDRMKYADEVLPKIIESAENPLKDGSWWMESEEPWQTLATCFEIQAALSTPNGPECHLSSFPIHQDGSCNGLQHYAALGRDSAGAASVNLAPSPLPQDVYSCVAAIVDRERAKDAENGDKTAAILEGFVRRKVIKQTVMTTVYGVTRFGARLQIAKQLKDIDDFPKEHVWAASQYLVIKTFDSIREMFTSTREIQDWFTEVAHLISGVRGESVEYITPLGLPVVQPYSRSSHTKSYYTTSGKCSVLNKLDKFERPNIMKQKNAFPPNFIHSLDSTHMMLTSLHCQRAGITFVSVHDCFWTHPSTVEIMNKICREQFVSLHSQPILEDLSSFMIDRYAYKENDCLDDCLPASAVRAKMNLNSLLERCPSKGDFKLENVLDSVYFFS